MLDVDKKQQMLAQFSDYLDQVPTEIKPNSHDNEIDLYRLFTELAALKAEVKIESRQVKSAIQEFQGLTELLKKNNEQLSSELANQRKKQQQDQEKIEKPFLISLLDLRDRMESAVKQAESYQPGWFVRRSEKTQQHLQSIHEGLEISLRRLDSQLQRYNVKSIEAIGTPLDPHTMQVSATDHNANLEDGIVLSEERKGYLRDGKLLRLAEVIVNKVVTNQNV